MEIGDYTPSERLDASEFWVPPGEVVGADPDETDDYPPEVVTVPMDDILPSTDRAEQLFSGLAPYRQMAEACREQGVDLPQVFWDAMPNSRTAPRLYTGRLSAMQRPINAADNLLNSGAAFNRRHNAVNQPIDIDYLPPDKHVRLLATLLNANIGQPIDDTPAYTIAGRSPDFWNVCPDLERYWHETHDEMAGEGRLSVQIFTHEGQPIALRKGRGLPSGLLLEDVAIGRQGMVYPAGSAVHLVTSRDNDVLYESRLVLPSPGVEVRPASDIISARFSRLTLFAADSRERAVHFTRHPHRACCADISQIRDTAAAAVERAERASVGAHLAANPQLVRRLVSSLDGLFND
jgi:hypothetical protein